MPRCDPRGETIHQNALGIPPKDLTGRCKITGIGGDQVTTPMWIEGGMVKQTIQPRLGWIDRAAT